MLIVPVMSLMLPPLDLMTEFLLFFFFTFVSHLMWQEALTYVKIYSNILIMSFFLRFLSSPSIISR